MDSLPWPAYLSLGAGEVAARAERALRLLGPDRCGACPRLCKVNRLADQRGLCAIGRQAVVASHFPHFGEENCLCRRRRCRAAPNRSICAPLHLGDMARPFCCHADECASVR